MAKANADYEHINIEIRNIDNPTPIIATYADYRLTNILDNPADYDLAVERFECPTTGIPIMFFEDNRYWVQMFYGATTIQKYVIWVPNSNKVPDGKGIFSYQEMLNMINTAIADAFTDLKIAEPLTPNTSPPFLIYTPATGLFSLCGDPTWANTANTAILYFNEPLGFLFDGLYQIAIFTPPTASFIDKFQQVFRDNKNNTIELPLPGGTAYYEMRQEYRSLNLWSTLQSIIFATQHIPVNAEYISTNNTDGKNEYRKILTDFIPEITNEARDLTKIQYIPPGVPRYYSFVSDLEFRTIDLSVFWKDKAGVLRPIYINRGDALTVKLQLRKKSNMIP